MDNIIFNIQKIIILFSVSLSLRILLELTSQNWIKTKAHTSTIVILPIVTYVITSVISGNIALSLGMVGALSIVRFRNPVRSPLELTVYFAAITMGIAASVHIRWLFYFVIAMLLVALSIKIATIIGKRYKKDFYKVSFSEGNSLATLEIGTNSDINLLDESKLLISKSKNENQISYVLASTEFNDLKILLDEIKTKNTILDYNIKSP